MNTFKTNESVLVTDYPYGRLKTEAKFSLEFSPKKGFRTVFQTRNPKTGRINNPKKSTYSPITRMVQDNTGFVSYIDTNFHNIGTNFQDAKTFVLKYWDTFTANEHKYIYSKIVTHLRVEMIALVQYCGADVEAVKQIIEEPVNLAMKGFKTGDKKYLETMTVDANTLEATKKPDYNPFRVTHMGPIKLSEL